MNGARLRVVGLDLSLTSTGVSDGTRHFAFRTSSKTVLEERLSHLQTGVVRFAMGTAYGAPRADLAVIEAPSYGSTGPGHDELAGLRIMVRYRIYRLGIPYVMVPPSTLKKYTTGRGSSTKDQMVMAMDALYGHGLAAIPKAHGRYDQTDAFALAAMGYDAMGQPLPLQSSAAEESERNEWDSIAALTGVKWPDPASL